MVRSETVVRYDALVRGLMRLPGPVRLVGVDGCGGAGKTTFADRLSRAADNCPVVHTDDFASYDEPLDWSPRLLRDVVEPLSNGRPATFHRYDWVARDFEQATTTVLPQPLVVIEGVGATRSAWADRLAIRVWVDTPRELRLQRGLDRDGADMAEFWQWWMAAEDLYVRADGPIERADLVVDGTPSVPHDADVEYVRLSEPRPAEPAARGSR
jgi:uridine kinase